MHKLQVVYWKEREENVIGLISMHQLGANDKENNHSSVGCDFIITLFTASATWQSLFFLGAELVLFPLIGECRVVTRGLESEKGCHSECFSPRNISKNEAQENFLCPFPLYLSAGYKVAYFQISLI